MKDMASRLRAVISSNVSNLVDAVENPVKLAKLLRHKLEEAILAERQRLAAAERKAKQLTGRIAEHGLCASSWDDKAAAAMAAGREDLARAALREREALHTAIAEDQDALAECRADLVASHDTLADLERRHAAAEARVSELAREARVATRRKDNAAAASALEQRLDFSASRTGGRKVAQDIAALDAEARVEADLARLRRKAETPPKRKGAR